MYRLKLKIVPNENVSILSTILLSKLIMAMMYGRRIIIAVLGHTRTIQAKIVKIHMDYRSTATSFLIKMSKSKILCH